MIFLAVLLPLITLLPLGWLWLWQNGYALFWLAGALAFGMIAYGVQAFALRKSVAETRVEPLADEAGTQPPDPGWTVREQAAWAAVEALATDVRPATLTDRDKILNLGVQTVEAVARQIHPGDKNPLWKFTVPEALALVERVSADLRPFVRDNIPLGDQLTVGQVLKIYRWRSAIGMAEKAYDIWRLVRLINPVTAAAQEAREQITKHLYAAVRDQVARRLAQGYVREVGRAAIDLYGGRLRVSQAELAGHLSASTLRDRSSIQPMAEPLRVFIGGLPESGKSSVVKALAKEVGTMVEALPDTRKYHAYELEWEGLASALVIDSPGAGATAKQQRKYAAKAGESDLIVWSVSAAREEGHADREVLAGIRKHFTNSPQRRLPPIVISLTHIDKLPPAGEWAPPYDLESPTTKKGRNIRDAVAAVAEELEIPPLDVVPVRVGAGHTPYNVAALSARVAAHVPAAQQAQLLRLMEDAAPRWSALRLGQQASGVVVSAARAAAPSILKRLTMRRERKKDGEP
jgi:uncharacterized protein